MTSNPSYIAPQSASAPITTNLRKDELAALLTVDKDATGQQRIIATGNSVPLVFCRQTGGIGGAWVTPPAARYGVEENANTGDYFAFGLVISDGQIPAIADDDIWKGPIRCNTLSEFAATNAYGSMPSTEYNYTLTSVGLDTPATSETTTERLSFSDTNVSYSFRGDSYTISINGCTAFSFNESKITTSATGATTYFHRWSAFSGNTLVDGSGLTESTSFSGSFNFANPVNFRLVVDTSFNNYWPNPAFLVFDDLSYSYTVTTTITTPEIAGAVTNLPLFAGSGGTFAGMSTLAVAGRYALDAETGIYRQQIRCFVRNGIEVERVLGGTGSSCSFPDLAYYLLKNASKVSTQLIDLPSLQEAEEFNSNYELFFNGVLANSVNLRDYLARVAPMFLLRFVQINGKFGLRPVLPLDGSFNINTDSITPSYTFDDSNIVAGSFQKDYINASERKPFCALMTYRSQTESLYGTPQTVEVRYSGTATDGPFEQYDMEEFCTTQNHATLVGRYILASRKHVTHTVSFQTTALIGNLVPTDIIQVTWDYTSSLVANGATTYLYQVDSVSEGADGVFRVEATHFPTTAAGASQVAIDTVAGI